MKTHSVKTMQLNIYDHQTAFEIHDDIHGATNATIRALKDDLLDQNYRSDNVLRYEITVTRIED